MDLREDLERALDGGPAHRAIEERLAIGRRATRRRRTAMGATVLATVVVIGGLGWAALPGDGDVADGTVATSPTTTPSTTSDTAEPTLRPDLFAFNLAGDLEIAPGVVVQRQVDQPIDRPDVTSAAAVVTFEGKTWWVMSAVRPRHGWSEQDPARSNRTFEQWMHEKDVLNTAPMFTDMPYDYGWVTLDADGVLTPHKGATIIEQTTPARLDQAPAGVPSATGTIEVHGARLCVIARNVPDDPFSGVVYFAESEFPGCGEAVNGYIYESSAP